MNKVTFLKMSSSVLTHEAKMINFNRCFHTQLEVFFQIKFHPGMKLTCKHKFFHPGDEISSQLHVNALLEEFCNSEWIVIE